jgi:hypothetical protein
VHRSPSINQAVADDAQLTGTIISTCEGQVNGITGRNLRFLYDRTLGQFKDPLTAMMFERDACSILSLKSEGLSPLSLRRSCDAP